MKNLFLSILLTATTFTAYSRTFIVDINGGGNFTSIQAGINAASTNDTVKVYPGTYNEQINLNKNIVLMGSGYENTVITGSFDPTVTMSAGKMQWFMISSQGGGGVYLNGGILRNCVIVGCMKDGILMTTNSTASVINCVIYNCGYYGIYAWAGGTLNVTNCISFNNGNNGFGSAYGSTLNLSYSCGSRYGTSGNQGWIDQNPQFTQPPLDFHISQGSPCWNSGNPSLLDPDGSRSDMGYFGGPDCPIYPVVTEIKIEGYGSGVNLKVKARANY
jgi:hypothetical protein